MLHEKYTNATKAHSAVFYHALRLVNNCLIYSWSTNGSVGPKGY